MFEGIAKDFVREHIERNEERRRGESKQAYAERIDALLAAEGMREAIARKTDSLVKEAQDERKAKEVGPIPVPPKYQDRRLPGHDILAPARRPRRAQGALRQLPRRRARGRRQPGHQPGPASTTCSRQQALAAYYLERKEREGWSEARLKPLLAGLVELLPWLEQWHNAYDPAFGMGLGDYFKSFVEDEARSLDTTPEALAGWAPAANTGGRAARGTARRSGRRRGEAAE